MRKKDGRPIFAKKIGKGFRLLKLEEIEDNYTYNETLDELETDRWMLIITKQDDI